VWLSLGNQDLKFYLPTKILVALRQQVFDEPQQRIIWSVLVARLTADVWQVLVRSCEAYVPGAWTTNFRNPDTVGQKDV
jgi:hypothetical protein